MPQSQNKYKFDMPKIRRRCRKVLRKRFKKKIKLNDVDRLWKQYVEYGIVRQLLKYGKVQIDKNWSMEIVGYRITEDRNFNTFARGIGVRNGIITPSANLHKGRDGYVYHIELTDNNFKEGVLIYKPSKKMSKAVHEALVNTNNYYRLVA